MGNARGADESCPFCDIAAGKVPAEIVLRDAHVVAFLDRRPLFKGHVLVVPVPHADDPDTLPPPQVPTLFAAVQRVARAVRRGLGADGTFVATNNGVSQSVAHLHVHVVPRHKKDGLRGFFWPRQTYASDAERTEYATRIRSAL